MDDLPEGVRGHTSVVLNDGQAVYCGGEDKNLVSVSKCYQKQEGNASWIPVSHTYWYLKIIGLTIPPYDIDISSNQLKLYIVHNSPCLL